MVPAAKIKKKKKTIAKMGCKPLKGNNRSYGLDCFGLPCFTFAGLSSMLEMDNFLNIFFNRKKKKKKELKRKSITSIFPSTQIESPIFYPLLLMIFFVILPISWYKLGEANLKPKVGNFVRSHRGPPFDAQC